MCVCVCESMSHHLALHQLLDGADQFSGTGSLRATGATGQSRCLPIRKRTKESESARDRERERERDAHRETRTSLKTDLETFCSPENFIISKKKKMEVEYILKYIPF